MLKLPLIRSEPRLCGRSATNLWRILILITVITCCILGLRVSELGFVGTNTTKSSVLRDVRNEIRHDDPYLRPGFLLKNGTDTLTHFWVPFDPSVPSPPHLLQSVVERKPLPWLNDKTVLIVGDSVDRYTAEWFCRLTNNTLYRTDLGGLYSFVNTEWMSHNTSPVICRVEHYNFSIIAFTHYGMQNVSDDYWQFKWGYSPPSTIESRIPLLRPLLEYYECEPDIVILSSGLWDLETWSREDAIAGRPPTEAFIQPEHFPHWLNRAEKFVDIVDSLYPNAFKMWRFLHFCQPYWMNVAISSSLRDDIQRWVFHDLRIFQLNNIYNSLLAKRPHLYKFSWGELLVGHLHDAMEDHSHPNKDFGGVLWSNMILYYLSRI